MNRKHLTAAAVLLLLIFPFIPATAQTPGGLTVNCGDGIIFNQGIEFVVRQVRPGFDYVATAVGSNGFDPIIAVIDPETGAAACSDDAYQQGNNLAYRYAADLPSSDQMVSNPSAPYTAQLTFANQSSEDAVDISLVVGNHGNQPGEFLLFLEGFAVTAADGAGDAVSVSVMPEMLEAETPLTVYMLKRGSGSNVNTLIYQEVPDSGDIALDADDLPLSCDDAGNADNCYGASERLDNSRITLGQNVLVGARTDSMLTVPLDRLRLSRGSDPVLTFRMSSSEGQTEGEYLLIFHAAVNWIPETWADSMPTLAQDALNATVSSEIDGASATVTCEDGTTITDGVEFVAHDVRSGFEYTATVIGFEDFDPVLAVLDTTTGDFICNDDSYPAAIYQFNPFSGDEDPRATNAQITFYQNSRSEFADVTLVVGGSQTPRGEFALVLEGMGISRDDGEGDFFSVNITPGMAAASTPLIVYMMMANTCECPSMDNPQMAVIVPGLNDVAVDTNGTPVVCDNTGNWSACYDKGFATWLYNLWIRTTPGYIEMTGFDAMLYPRLNGLELSSNREDNYLTFMMSGSERDGYDIEGQYWLVFHVTDW